MSEQNNRVYVGNLSYQVGWQDLKDYMRSAGNVTHADILLNRDGRSKGCGIVEFETVEEAQKAIEELSETELMGRTIFVREDRESHPKPAATDRPVRTQNRPANGHSVFVGNLPFSVSWQDLKDLFRECGNVIRADVLMNNGRSKGMGIVMFETKDESIKAIEMYNQYEWNGRTIEVREDRFARQ
ncbi:hypothetical protein BC833DRAFT_606995 [Globomyces pollinis-pini]|nr:hypothetical protein BC833DRAFT_606995 [Globomyces pollinis-pini]